jgi:hypothetical protein
MTLTETGGIIVTTASESSASVDVSLSETSDTHMTLTEE